MKDDAVSKLILDELKRNGDQLEVVKGTLTKHAVTLAVYNSTLKQLTETVEHHVKRSDNADDDRKEIKDKVDEIEEKVEHIDGHVKDLGPFITIFKTLFSTKSMKWTITFLVLITTVITTYYVVRNPSSEILKKISKPLNIIN